MPDPTPRWKYRFRNYSRAFILLRDAIETAAVRDLTQLEKEGTIQRFAYTMELAWKVMADYLESENVVFDQKTPRSVIRNASETNIIADAASWMDALDARNKMSHTYDFTKFEQVIQEIQDSYLALFDALYIFLLDKDT